MCGAADNLGTFQLTVFSCLHVRKLTEGNDHMANIKAEIKII